MNRRQFSLKTMFWLTALVAAFFSGRWQQRWQLNDEVRDIEMREKKLTYDEIRLVRGNADVDVQRAALLQNWLKFRKAVDEFKSARNATANHRAKDRVD